MLYGDHIIPFNNSKTYGVEEQSWCTQLGGVVCRFNMVTQHNFTVPPTH